MTADASATRDFDELPDGSERVERERSNLYRNFMQAPFAVAVLRGEAMVVELANDAMCAHWGERESILGQPLRRVLPDVVGRPLLAVLNDVYRTGQSHQGRDELTRVKAASDAPFAERYHSSVYTALFDDAARVDGVMMTAFEVTDQVLARSSVNEARAQAEELALALQSDGVGLGAAFTVTLPVIAAHEPGLDTPRASLEGTKARQVHASDVSLTNVRALVVDDDADSLELMRLVLELAGAEVATASSAEAALAAGSAFDIIISDLGMPHIDGYGLLERLRARPDTASIPAMALTAYARNEDREKARAAGFQQHIAKPFDAEEILRLVKHWAGRSATRGT